MLAKIDIAAAELKQESVLEKFDEILFKPIEYIKKIPYHYTYLFCKMINHWFQIPEEMFETLYQVFDTLTENWFL